MLYKGRVKEVRSFVREECGETGVLCPKGEDMDGHGTHAASVFLEIDPFSEVYVAKVFEKRGQKQGKALQEALQVGVARVSVTFLFQNLQVTANPAGNYACSASLEGPGDLAFIRLRRTGEHHSTCHLGC